MPTTTHLSTYLNDHLAGSMAGLETLDGLEAAFPRNDVKKLVKRLRRKLELEREQLQSLMDELDITRSPVRQLTAWVSEKVIRLKMRFDDRDNGPFRLFETLEALSVAIEGKRLLWVALSSTSEVNPALANLNFPKLMAMAKSQRRLVEALRLEAAREAFPAAVGSAAA